MDTLTERLRKSQQALLEQGTELWGKTVDASRGLATAVQGEARDWGTYLRDRAGELGLTKLAEDPRVARVTATATDVLERVVGRPFRHSEAGGGSSSSEDGGAPPDGASSSATGSASQASSSSASASA